MQEHIYFLFEQRLLLELGVEFFLAPYLPLSLVHVGRQLKGDWLNVSCDNRAGSELPAVVGDPANLSFVIFAVHETVNQCPS